MKKKSEQIDIDDFLNPNEKVDPMTGEIKTIGIEKLNQVIIKQTVRKDGTLRIQQDFTNCPTLTEQHTAHLSDINYLIEKYKPDELAAYIAARNQYRQEIVGHDFSKEPSLQEAKNIVYRSQKEFNELDPKIRSAFRDHVEFLKFIDNPANAQKMLDMGILTKRQVENLQSLEPVLPKDDSKTTPKKEDTVST